VNTNSDNNYFLSRGCSQAPDSHQNNDNVYKHNCSKLDTYDWLKNIPIPETQAKFDCIEIRFKNSRKEFYRTIPELNLIVGDFVAVEASPGHDIGIVSLTGELVRLQMKKKNVNPKSEEIKKVYRKARPNDIEKWLAATELENPTMLKARKIAADLNLEMKINDVEFQGDKTKVIFYYTAEERVDFRELIKIFAEKFMTRIEMRQIGVRQEACRLGGIGSCGRELCCSTWLTNFCSVSTNSARNQQLPLNPQKLAGQCGKLKCCLNYENDCYLDILKEFPSKDINLKTKKGEAIHQKNDLLSKTVWYSYIDDPSNLLAIPLKEVWKIIELNKKNNFPESLDDFAKTKGKIEFFENVVGQDDLTRFDKLK